MKEVLGNNNEMSDPNTGNIADSDECAPQLENYLNKLIELVPGLKEIDREEKVKRILFSGEDEPSSSSAINQLQNLDLNSAKSITDLEILQSVLDYIRDLQSKVN